MAGRERERRIRLPTKDGQRGALAGIVTRGRRTAFHEDFYHSVLTWKWWQFFTFVAAAFLGVNAVFAVLYSLQAGSIANSDGTLESLERQNIIRTLRETKGVIAGPGGAALRLGMKRTTLQSRILKMRISRQEYR